MTAPATPSTASPATVFPAPRAVVDLPRSSAVRGLEWLGPAIPYPEMEKRGDTFPLTWADDGEIYTSAGDPCWGGKGDGLDAERITGNPPAHRIDRLNDMMGLHGWGGTGPKPTGMICVAGVLYLAYQNATGKGVPDETVINYGHGYDGHIISSRDHGRTWQPNLPGEHARWQPNLSDLRGPMFPGRLFGAPAFINFGQNNAAARDRYVYAISGEGWDNGCHCRLGRVPADAILRAESWEFAAELRPGAEPRWSSALKDAVPVLSHPGYLGTVDMVYVATLRRYLLLGWHHKVKSNPDAGSELSIYDAPEPWGPFTLVHHEDPWETAEVNPYNPRLPLRWFNPGTLEGWLLFSGSWRHGGTSPHYRAHVRPFRLRRD